MKLTENSTLVLNFVKENGGKVAITELAEGLGKAPRSVSANVTDLTKKGLAVREKEQMEDQTITYVTLTDEGMDFVPSAE